MRSFTYPDLHVTLIFSVRYLNGALDSGSDRNQLTNEFSRKSRDFVPSSEPGARLPHMPLRLMNTSGRKKVCLLPSSSPPHPRQKKRKEKTHRKKKEVILAKFPSSDDIEYIASVLLLTTPFSCSQDNISTLDLVAPDKLEFLLIIAPAKKSYDLALAAYIVAQELEVSLKVCVIWPYGSFDDENNSGSGDTLQPWDDYVDVEEVKSSPSWWETCQMSSRGAIMVRPDDHIAWRTTAEPGSDAVDQMRKLFSRILGRSVVSG